MNTELLTCCFTHCRVRNCDNHLPWQSTAVVPSDNHLPWQSTAVVPSDNHLPWQSTAVVPSDNHLPWQNTAVVPSTFVLEWVLICHVCSAFLFGLQTAVVSKFTNKLCSVHQFNFIFLNSHTSLTSVHQTSDYKIWTNCRIYFSWK